MKLFFALLLLFFAKNDSFAGAFESFSHGEKNPSDYFGPTRPIYRLNTFQGQVEHSEERENDRPYDNRLSSDLIELKEFLNNDFVQSSLCTNANLSENSEYIRYLYRLISLSFLYESLTLYQETAINFGIKDHSCSISWKEFLNQCQPKSEEMKKFIRRAGKVVESYKYSLPQDHSFKRFMTNWQDFLKKKFNYVIV